MNVANLSLCKELYELSGWDDNELWDCTYRNQTVNATLNRVQIASDRGEYYWTDPRYDLGYLLRKLPNASIHTDHPYDAIYYSYRKGGYDTQTLHFKADTPEDAACKLAIELFKQGILTKA